MIQILFIFGVMYGYRAPLSSASGGKIDPRCYEQDYVRAWVYFTDKGVQIDKYDNALRAVRSKINKSSLNRRALRRGIIDYGDIPLNEDYILEVESRGGLLIKKSKWLNAASFWIARQDLDNIADLDFVYKVVSVACHKGASEVEIAVEDTAVYGLAYRQLKMFNIDSLKQKGVSGSNIRVGFLDTGLRRKHTALVSTNIIDEYDFLGGDEIYLENTPITEKYGVYSSIVFHGSTNRLKLFLEGDTTSNYNPVRDILWTYSIDDGNNWSPVKKLTNNYNNWVTELDVCGRDTIFVFYHDRNGINYLVISDTTVLVNPTLINSFSYQEPSAVQIGDTVYAFYQNKTKLYIRKGSLAGFLPELVIDSSLTNVKKPEAVGNATKVGVFYYTYPEDSLYFLKAPMPITIFTKSFIAFGKNPEAISSGDTIFLSYQDITANPLFRVAFAKSANFGETFTTPVFLSDSLNSIGKISIEKSGNTIMIAWENEGKIYFRSSYDNGDNFGNLDSLNKEFVYLPALGKNSSGIIKIYCERGDTITDGYSTIDPHYFYPRHGTEMLGLVGGFLSGSYIGVAPGAQFLVAKTENPDSVYEFPVEEDTWIAGLEWLESKGADIVSSSLGYTDWYNWPLDYDGKTSPASIAAYEATRRGVVVVNAAGNVALPRIVVPGDAMGVITVGGIDSLYSRWQYSGYGPTYDGRMKPEIMCLSAAPVVIDPDSTNSYLYSFGTSGATALVSGICALLLEGHPSWNVDSVRDALFETASLADSPSDSMGYGWPDALAAFYYSLPDWDTVPGNHFLVPYPNPFIPKEHENIYLPFKLETACAAECRIYSISGRLIKEENRPGLLLTPGIYNDRDPLSHNAAFIWDGKDAEGNDVGSGVYHCVLLTHGAGNDITKIAVVR